jgi:predicted HicB family RNase H-like nuclease
MLQGALKLNQQDLVLKYEYRVAWEQEDEVYVARVAEWPSLTAHAQDPDAAMRELREVVAFAIQDCEAQGEDYPQPNSLKEYSGKLVVRMAPALHRELATAAKAVGASLNSYIVQRLVSSR